MIRFPITPAENRGRPVFFAPAGLDFQFGGEG
jgi:hypothetical protein